MIGSLAYYIVNLKKNFSRFCQERLQKLGLSNGLLYFLIYIGKKPNCTPGRLSAGLRADTGHTTRSIKKLVELGYVKRIKSPEDKRAFLLSLTPKGLCVFEELKDIFFEWDGAVCGAMSEEQKEKLLSLLELILSGTGQEFHI